MLTPLQRLRRRLRRNEDRLDQLTERIPAVDDRLARYRADPSRLMVDAGFTPDFWQRAFLASTDRFNLMLCAR
jgi:hypothetical protein